MDISHTTDVLRRGHSLPHTANMNISLYDGMESNKEEKVNSDCENKTKQKKGTWAEAPYLGNR